MDDSPSDKMLDRGHARQGMQLVQQAVKRGWKIPEVYYAELPPKLWQIIDNPLSPDRDRIRAMETLRSLNRDNLDAAIALDRMERLDAEQPTEGTAVTVKVVYEDRLPQRDLPG